MAEYWTPGEIQRQTDRYVKSIIEDHRHVVRGGTPWFPKHMSGSKPHRELSGNLVEDLAAARGDGVSFAEDGTPIGSRLIDRVHIVNSLAYDPQKLGPENWRYKRLVAVFAGRSLRGELLALCTMHERGTGNELSDEIYQLNNGVMFTPGASSVFERRGSGISPLGLADNQTVPWIEEFLNDELYGANGLERTVSPEVDGYKTTISGSLLDKSKKVGFGTAKATVTLLFGKPSGARNSNS